MSVEGGGLGGIGGGIGGGIAAGAGGGIGAGVSIGPALGGVGLGMSSGIETGGLTGAVPALAGSGILGELRGFGGSGPVNEGPVGLSDLQATVPWQAEVTNPLGQANFDVLSQAGDVAGQAWGSFTEPDAIPVGQPKIDVFSQVEEVAAEAWDFNAVTQAEEILSEAQKPAISSPVIPAEAGIYTNNLWIPDKQSLRPDGLQVGDDKGVEPAILPQVEPMVMPFIAPSILDFPKPEVVVSPALKPAVQTESLPGSGIANEAVPAIMVQPALEEQKIEETVTERAALKQKDTVGEELVAKRKKYVVDKPKLIQRLRSVGQAVRYAKLESEKLGLGKKIIGWMVNKFLYLSHPAYMSQVVQPEGPDGTIPIIEETIKAKAEFTTEGEVETVVWNNRPVSEAEEGESVSDEEVRKVFKDRIVKPGGPVQIFEKRIVQKRQKSVSLYPVPTLTDSKIETKRENNLRDLNLMQVFPKAA